MEFAGILILVLTFVFLLALGVPIAYSIGISGAVTLLVSILPLPAFTTLSQRMATALDSFALLAIPFFILAGQIPNSLLLFEDSTAVASHIKRLSSFADTAGGFMFSTSGPIHEGIPAEAFINLVQAIHQYGQNNASRALAAR